MRTILRGLLRFLEIAFGTPDIYDEGITEAAIWCAPDPLVKQNIALQAILMKDTANRIDTARKEKESIVDKTQTRAERMLERLERMRQLVQELLPEKPKDPTAGAGKC